MHGGSAVGPVIAALERKKGRQRTKMPPSLSSIQWLGALRRFRCFFGPRGMAATAVSTRQPLQEEEPGLAADETSVGY